MTSLTWCADIHLDHADPAVQDRFIETLRETSGETVVICGDISTSRRITADLERIADGTGRRIYYVLGNHDHFGGSIAALRDSIIALGERRSDVQWLPPAGVVSLGDGIVLIGVDGWADGRLGNALTTPLRLNDDRLITELAAQPNRSHRLAVKRALADADAERLATLIERAAGEATTVVIATHVPPFTDVLPPRGHLATPDWWPLLICGATGETITAESAKYPEHEFIVLTAHTHVAADVRVGENVRVVTAAARYGEPTVQTLTVDGE